MPKRKEPELDPKEQFKRFQKTAKEHGVRDVEHIETAFGKLAKAVKDRDRKSSK